MSLGKTLSLGFLALCVLGTPAQADPISSMTSSGQWTFWSQASNSTIGTPTYSAVNTPPPAPPAPISAPTIQNVTASSTSSPPPERSSSGQPDAFINFGNGDYAGANLMTTGTIQPWYESSSVTQAFGGVPSTQQQADFANTVLGHVEQTFQNSGIDVNLTLDPNAKAPHTLSVVSGATYGMNPNAIGISEVGGSGFSFIDKLSYANSVDELAMADGRNIAHELMHSFGVSSHHDQSGKYLDAASATWDMLTASDTKFSPEASADIRASLAGLRSNSGGTIGAETLGSASSHTLSCHCLFCEQGTVLRGPLAMELGANPVPEPATMVLWAAGALGSVIAARRRRNRGE